MFGDIKNVKKLIKEGYSINEKDEEYHTPIMIAVDDNYYKLTKIFLRRKCDLQQVDINGETVLFKAVKKNRKKIVKKILKHSDMSDLNFLLYTKNHKDETPLSIAEKNKDNDIIRLLNIYRIKLLSRKQQKK